MRDVSSEVLRFREAGRHLWNCFLMPGENVVDSNIEESFESIERELLRCLVFSKSPEDADCYRQGAIDRLIIKQRNPGADVQIQYGEKDSNGNVRWEKGRIYTSNDEFPDLRFIDFFDWTHFGFIDYGFVRALEIKGRRLALLPQQSCSFWLAEY
jgi:hypothetical protein